MHLTRIKINSERFPDTQVYPFNLAVFQSSQEMCFSQPVTFLVGENGTGKSTLLRAICQQCGIHIWEEAERVRYRPSPYEKQFHRYLVVEWHDGPVPGSFFGSHLFHFFSQVLDEWAVSDPGLIDHFGGQSLLSLSHGQSLMSYFRSRYQLKGLYFLDEPETALSPRSQLDLLNLIQTMSQAGHAQFLIATHSPILLACPDATIYSFNGQAIKKVAYEETDHFKIYRQFLRNPRQYLQEKPLSSAL